MVEESFLDMYAFVCGWHAWNKKLEYLNSGVLHNHDAVSILMFSTFVVFDDEHSYEVLL